MSSEAEPHFRALVRQAVALVGSQAVLAERMSKSQQWVSALCTRADQIPAENALAIHYATGGKVCASRLRPDLWTSPDHVPPEAPLVPAQSPDLEKAS
ncbi:transcriptional regulator [Afipia carboxidovorans]|uniref:transcriptional regulator n=1 Tax=Afipia carboxidovorans TaxID=40137 RepID=UPI0030CE2B3B